MIPADGGWIDVKAARGAACLVAAVLAALLASGASATPAASAAGPVSTGQIDRATPVRGQLRDDLLAGSVRGGRSPRPDPAHPILIRSSLRVGGTRALLVSFRSLAGRPCLGVTLARAGVRATPVECLPACRETVCLAIYSGGSLPAGTRILAGTASPRIDELRIGTPAGATRRYRVSRSRVGSPAVAPILARVGAVRRVGAFADGRELAWVRFFG